MRKEKKIARQKQRRDKRTQREFFAGDKRR